MIKVKPGFILLAIFLFSLFILYSNTFMLFSDAHAGAKGADGLEYALSIDGGDLLSTIESHYPLYHFTGFIFHKIVLNLTGNSAIRSIWSLKLISTFCGVLGIYLFYLLLLELHRNILGVRKNRSKEICLVFSVDS